MASWLDLNSIPKVIPPGANNSHQCALTCSKIKAYEIYWLKIVNALGLYYLIYNFGTTLSCLQGLLSFNNCNLPALGSKSRYLCSAHGASSRRQENAILIPSERLFVPLWLIYRSIICHLKTLAVRMMYRYSVQERKTCIPVISDYFTSYVMIV